MRLAICLVFATIALLNKSVVPVEAQERRQLTFAEKVAPAVKKQLEINYPNDPEARDSLFTAWKTANGLKLAVEEDAGRVLRDNQRLTGTRSREQVLAELNGVIEDIERINDVRRRLITKGDQLLHEVISPGAPPSSTNQPQGTSNPTTTPNPDGTTKLRGDSIGDDRDLAPVYTGWRLNRVRAELKKSEAFQQLQTFQQAISSLGANASPTQFVQTLNEIDGAQPRDDNNLEPGGTNFFLALGRVASVQNRITAHNSRLPMVGESPEDRARFNRYADDLNKELQRNLSELGDDISDLTAGPQRESPRSSSSQRIRDLLNRRGSRRSADGMICPTEPETSPPSTKLRRVPN